MEEKNNNNNKKSLVWTIILLVILVILAVVYFKNVNFNPKNENREESGISDEKLVSLTSGKEIAEEFLKQEETQPLRVLKPEGDKGTTTIREYEVKFEKGSFTPKTLIITSGGRIQINFKSVDEEFDVLFPAPIGAYLKVKKGETAVMGLDVPEERKGQYVFTCRDVCPQGNKPVGIFVIK